MADTELLPTITGPEGFGRAFPVSRETLDALRRYADALQRWQQTVNLVSPTTIPEMWHRHFADSAQLARLAPEAGTWIDLGSGGGFPGMVIAVLNANRQDFRMHLVESNGKKCAFLSDVARAARAPVTIHHLRIEKMGTEWQGERPDVISARALAPLHDLLGLAAPLFSCTTRGLFPKGSGAATEVAAAEKNWRFSAEMIPSLTGRNSTIVAVTGLMAKETIA